jgi:CBS domain-containing protein
MKIGEVATHQVVTIGRSASVVEAARTMKEHHVGQLVLVAEKESERVPVGLITERDLVISVLAEGAQNLAAIRVGDIASKELMVADSDEDAEEVARKMLALGLRRVPVVNALGALVGLATYEDLVAWMTGELADFAQLGPTR